jgi:tetratricopeptide (TPR) repeat protein
MLEPRVMRVLVALAASEGQVYSRDDLIALCWDGQIVGDNAINRVISRLRATLADLAGEAVRLETITKVGFRLVVDAAVDPIEPSPTEVDEPYAPPVLQSISPPRAPLSRRVAIGGVLAIGGAGAIGFAGWRSATSRHRPLPEARELYERGNVLMKSAGAGTTRQAMTFYQRAIEIDPDYADAWGALAIGYRHGLDGFTRGEKLAYPRLLRSAAKRALALDPDQPDANLALVVAEPYNGRWHTVEPQLREQVRLFPGYWYAHAQLGLLLQDVGRFEDAIPFSRRVTEIDPLLPVAWAGLARTLANAGRDHEADAVLDEGFRRFPAHVALWFTRYSILVNSRRFAEAALFANDKRTFPEDFPSRLGKTYSDLADGISTRDPVKIGASRDYLRIAMSAPDPGGIEVVPRFAPLLAALDEPDAAMAALEAYFLGGTLFGQQIAPPFALDLRPTQALFVAPILAIRNDRFTALLERTGLEDYWRRSGSQPDFRRN